MIAIDARYCKGCGICVHFCPKHILEISSEVGARGYYMPHVTNEAECANCNQCELYCPDFAIYIVQDEECGHR